MNLSGYTTTPTTLGEGAELAGAVGRSPAGPGPDVLGASALDGNKVLSSEGEDVGKIKEIMLDVRSGHIAYAVLSVGGFLGIGDKLLAIHGVRLRSIRTASPSCSRCPPSRSRTRLASIRTIGPPWQTLNGPQRSTPTTAANRIGDAERKAGARSWTICAWASQCRIRRHRRLGATSIFEAVTLSVHDI
jgi:sporulation protein YlmC with PRC-barrel domain